MSTKEPDKLYTITSVELYGHARRKDAFRVDVKSRCHDGIADTRRYLTTKKDLVKSLTAIFNSVEEE